MDFDEDFGIMWFFALIILLLGVLIGSTILTDSIEIQEIKQVDKGYYITINDEIYYKEV